MKKFFLLAIIASAATATCFAASPWDGTWKLNAAKSKLTGTTFTVEKNGNMYTMHDSSMTFKFACDGKDYPVIADRTITCTENGLKSTTVAKASGKVLATTAHEISADGKTRTNVTTGTRPDGTSFKDSDTYVRTAGSGTGLAGTWKNTKETQSAPSLWILKVNGDVLHSEDPGYKSVSDAKLNGTPAPLKGPTVPEGVMVTNKSDGVNKVTWTATYKGKEMSTDVTTLSADGKTLTDVSWTPGKENEKQTFVYEKQ